ncbi:TrmH family RNA methyltransferase [Nocardioides bizhenqiangii]|uniref:RNA methyltransferase n=1 Tax=Nocardioides bizhenqiangii TaxID=3095076 RepID=A0ABZ0ZWQ3_9ACTN|nr:MULTISPECIES: RNA methyltransferase [unclassified Nocardioides]MDZ5622151.1 RNA methyltransferase [Nocardioides sp. HM23]WQQ28668.1 RNA methyltransferase [Nocardioides sp. HM61]
MTPLTVGNARVKEARKLSRRSVRTERRLFLADGPKAVEGALEVPDRVVEVFATPSAAEQHAALLAGADATLVDDRALASLSDAVNPAGLVAVVRHFDQAVDDMLDANGMLVICADIRDPGNAGTVLRTADAAGAHAVVFAGQSVDPYNPKTVRASVGSLFHVPFAIDSDPEGLIRNAQANGWVVLAADGGGEVDLFEADDLLNQRVAWLFGNEAWGLPAELAELADHRVRIPIHGRAESLNLATAAALCLYASARSLRNQGH